MSKPSLTKRNELFNETVKSSVVEGHYDLSCCKSGSYSMGILYPIYCRNDIVPGDKFKLSSAPFIRFLPMVSPALTSVDVSVRYFFVPKRLLWSYWKKFITPHSSEDVNLIEPYIPNFIVGKNNSNIFNVAGSLYDYMGCSSIPWYLQGGTNGVFGSQAVGNSSVLWDSDTNFGLSCPSKLMTNYFEGYVAENNLSPILYSAYPYLAYNFIYNEYFRDENLQDEAYCSHDSTDFNLDPSLFYLRRINWDKDYFTSALPWVTQSVFATPVITSGDTIEELREASALTKWLEIQAIGGHRYQESILSHFGIRVPDEAAQIPVYLGGGMCPAQIQSVEQNSSTFTEETPLATLAGKATAADSIYVDHFEFKEHGVLMGVMYVRPKAVYADVTPRDLFNPASRHDYLWPSFVNLGDEAIKQNELNPGWFFQNGDFGYTMRYGSYRNSFDQVHGQLRPMETMEYWTQARSWKKDLASGTFDDVVDGISINKDFIQCKPSHRIFSMVDPKVPDNLVGEVTTFVDAFRPAPSYVDPKLD